MTNSAEQELMRVVREALSEEMCEKLIHGIIGDINNTGSIRDRLSFLLATEMGLLHAEMLQDSSIKDPVARMVMANKTREDYCEYKLERVAQYVDADPEPEQEVFRVEVRIPKRQRTHRGICQ